jgi:DNA-binding IclR family transcriptional regulator
MAQKPRVQCLDRALNILEALAQRDRMGVTELATEVGLHVSTVHNILGVLRARGYVLNDAGRYRCGPALLALADRNGLLRSIPEVAQPLLEAITNHTGESAVVGVLSGAGLSIVAATPSADGLSCPAVNQTFRPALMLATGRLLVAHGPEENWDRHLAEYREKVPAADRTPEDDREAWRRELTRTRHEEVCVVPRGQDSGSVAVAVRDAGGVVVAALGANSIGRLTDAIHWNRLVEEVSEAGKHVSAGLGYRSVPRKVI